MYGHKNDLHQFLDFFKISLPVTYEIFDLALRAVINHFEIHTINSLITKKRD